MKMQIDNDYERDFCKWSFRQAKLLRAGKLTEADIENIAEEIESMGKSEKRELISRLKVLFLHLLKWDYQPAKQSKSWKNTIKVQRMEIFDHLEDNPSLKSKMAEIMDKAYSRARVEASTETGLDETAFPDICPYNFKEAMEKEVLF